MDNLDRTVAFLAKRDGTDKVRNSTVGNHGIWLHIIMRLAPLLPRGHHRFPHPLHVSGPSSPRMKRGLIARMACEGAQASPVHSEARLGHQSRGHRHACSTRPQPLRGQHRQQQVLDSQNHAFATVNRCLATLHGPYDAIFQTGVAAWQAPGVPSKLAHLLRWRAARLQKPVAARRKAYKLGKFLADVNKLRKVPITDELLYLELLANAGNMVYLFMEQCTWCAAPEDVVTIQLPKV